MTTEIKILILFIASLLPLTAFADDDCDIRYIEVTGTSEVETVPDEIHYVIEIREYFEEEFKDGAKPEDYRTKVSLSEIERGLRAALKKVRDYGQCRQDTGGRRHMAKGRARFPRFQNF